MMQARDWVSFFAGLAVGLLGLLPMLGYFTFLNDLKVSVVVWIVAVAALYLVWNSIIEITNSNIIGTFSIAIAGIALLSGLLPVLHSFGIGWGWFELKWLPGTVYNFILIIEGAFLMVATFAMEL
ncbi:hypothetical protein HYT53_06240 [Candidatus Woesearchaeota archaeon]|nr:hypothetical protein [Candidatus Woesearchaeota archaeon]